jgi:hypothetical protein
MTNDLKSIKLGEITGENRRTCDKKIGSNIFIVGMVVGEFCKNYTCKIGDFKIMNHIYM